MIPTGIWLLAKNLWYTFSGKTMTKVERYNYILLSILGCFWNIFVLLFLIMIPIGIWLLKAKILSHTFSGKKQFTLVFMSQIPGNNLWHTCSGINMKKVQLPDINILYSVSWGWFYKKMSLFFLITIPIGIWLIKRQKPLVRSFF